MNDKSDRTATDREVSDAYRELANERAPRALNDKVLRMAAAAKPVRNFIPGAWMKPIAWAATIGLSLAIVLELTQVPQTAPDLDGVAPARTADEAARPTPASIQKSAETESDARQDRAGQTTPSVVTEPSTVAEPGDISTERREIKPAVHRAQLPVTEAAPAPTINLGPQAAETAATSNGRSATDDTDNAVSSAADAATVSSMAVSAGKLRTAERWLCPASARETAEDWYRCIDAQRATSPPPAIENEIEALRERFPEFLIPDADK